MTLDVVGGVDDDGQLGPDRGLDAMGELGAADPAGQQDDGHPTTLLPPLSSSAARTSPILARVSPSYGAGSRTITVRKPSSR